MRTLARLVAIAASLLAFAPASRMLAAQTGGTEEYQVKAAFLYNFTKFIEWRGVPLARADDSTAVFCVCGGRTPVKAMSETLESKKGVSVRSLRPGNDPKGCTILFQAVGEKPFRENWSEIAKSGVLVVTEDPAQLSRGSILNFYLADGKVRFEANLDGAKASGFRLNSQLLHLARIAKPEGGKE